MSSAADSLALVRRAQQNAARAAAEWTPVDAARITECRFALDSAASDLLTVMESIQPETAPTQNVAYSEMRADLLALKRSLAGLNHLMDAAAAFIKSLPGHNGRPGETYGAGGQLSTFSATPASSVEA